MVDRGQPQPGRNHMRHGGMCGWTRADRRHSVSPRGVLGRLHPSCFRKRHQIRSEEHTSEIQSLMRNSYDVFCLKKKTHIHNKEHYTIAISIVLHNTITTC